MSNPWDRPPSPTRGDPDENTTCAGVGRVLTRWENVEIELSHMFAICIGKYHQEAAYDEYYDRGKTTQARIKSVEEKAERVLQNQQLEADFCIFARKTGKFSERRHEVAHGMVRPIQWYGVGGMTLRETEKIQYCVVPPRYQRSWFDQNQMPLYVYTSVELAELERKLADLAQEATKIRENFLSLRPS
jgi:hypothetical protein